MSLQHFSALYLPAIEDELRHALGSGAPELREYYLMMEYHLGWTDAAGSPLHDPSATGKRIRPLLCLLTCTAVGGAWECALPIAAAVELLHNFSLLHDDIQDGSTLRRGRPTAWTVWGQAQAINAGDAMFTLAHLAPHALIERGVSASTALAALREFDRTCLKLTQGQHLDIRFETRERVTVDEYRLMIEGKTAALIACCAKLGALIGGAPDEQVTHLGEYGRHLGLAFQVHDDWLGIWGDPAVTGKSAASDLEARKKSLPVVFGLERSADFARAYAQPRSPEAPVSALAHTLETLGAQAYTRQMAEQLSQTALHHLEAARLTGAGALALRELTAQLLRRNQ